MYCKLPPVDDYKGHVQGEAGERELLPALRGSEGGAGDSTQGTTLLHSSTHPHTCIYVSCVQRCGLWKAVVALDHRMACDLRHTCIPTTFGPYIPGTGTYLFMFVLMERFEIWL